MITFGRIHGSQHKVMDGIVVWGVDSCEEVDVAFLNKAVKRFERHEKQEYVVCNDTLREHEPRELMTDASHIL